MPRPMRLAAKSSTDGVYLRIRISHPMETGLRQDKTSGKPIPAHFIQALIVRLNGKVVMNADLGTAIAKDPAFKILIHGAKTGDTLTINWTDNFGEKGSAKTIVK